MPHQCIAYYQKQSPASALLKRCPVKFRECQRKNWTLHGRYFLVNFASYSAEQPREAASILSLLIIYYKSVLETTNSIVGIKGAVMQIEKALINNRLRVSKVF